MEQVLQFMLGGGGAAIMERGGQCGEVWRQANTFLGALLNPKRRVGGQAQRTVSPGLGPSPVK